jgi:hypothetical protein
VPTIPLGAPGLKRGSGFATHNPATGTVSGSVTTLRAATFDQTNVNSCLAAPLRDKPLPDPKFTRDPAPRIDLPAPCNLCVSHPDHLNPAVTRFRYLLPVGKPGWTCDATRIGCMDLCDVDPNTRAYTRIRASATEVVDKCAIQGPH